MHTYLIQISVLFYLKSSFNSPYRRSFHKPKFSLGQLRLTREYSFDSFPVKKFFDVVGLIDSYVMKYLQVPSL